MEENINSNKSSSLRYIIFAVILLAILGSSVAYVIKSGKLGKIKLALTKPKPPKVSSHVLFLTSPVTSFSGTVEKVKGNSVWVKQKISREQNVPVPADVAAASDEAPESVPVVVNRIIRYKVKITDNTQITRSVPGIPYLFKTAESGKPEKLTLKSIKSGQMVNITTNTDLRTLRKNEFEAETIQINMISNSISGRISKIVGNKIYIKSIPPIPPQTSEEERKTPEEKEYTLVVDQTTEISAADYSGSGGKPKRYTLGDLKQNMQITAYTDVDTAFVYQFIALRIEPVIESSAEPVAEATETVSPPPDVKEESPTASVTQTTEEEK